MAIRIVKRIPFPAEAGGNIIKSEHYLKQVAAGDIVEKAERRAAEILQEAQALSDKAFKQGYQEGLEQARQESVEALAQGKLRASHYLASAKRGVVELVQAAVEKLIRKEADIAVVRGLVSGALEKLKDEHRITISVSPLLMNEKSRLLEELANGFPAVEFFEVKSDAALGCDECVIESESGIIRGSVDEQLQKLKILLEQVLA